MEHERRWGLCESWKGKYGFIKDEFGETWLALPAQISPQQAADGKLRAGESVNFMLCESQGKMCAGDIILETPRPMRPATNLRGVVIEWNEDRGFGFIAVGSTNYFCHARDTVGYERKLKHGQHVAFDCVVAGDGRGRAVSVRPVET